MLCSKGYPSKYKKNISIEGLNSLLLKKNEFIFHAGTKIENNNILSSGGRVLNFVSISNDFKKSRDDIIKIINDLSWKNGFFRRRPG